MEGKWYRITGISKEQYELWKDDLREDILVWRAGENMDLRIRLTWFQAIRMKLAMLRINMKNPIRLQLKKDQIQRDFGLSFSFREINMLLYENNKLIYFKEEFKMKTYFIQTDSKDESDAVLMGLRSYDVKDVDVKTSVLHYEAISFACKKKVWKQIKKKLGLEVTSVFSQIKVEPQALPFVSNLD